MEQVKIVFSENNSIRKVALDVTSIATLEQGLNTMFGLKVGEYKLSYVDDDKDVIDLPHDCSTNEFEEFRKRRGGLRLVVSKSVSSTNENAKKVPSKEEEEEEEQQQQEEDWEDMYEESKPSSSTASENSNNESKKKDEHQQQEEEAKHHEPSLAELLSNPDVVRDIQAAITSPIVTDFVVSIASASSKEDPAAVMDSIFSKLPLVSAVVEEFMDSHEEFRKYGDGLLNNVVQGCLFGNLFGSPSTSYGHCGRSSSRSGFPCGSFSSPSSAPVMPVHRFVSCDGCSEHENLRSLAEQEGYIQEDGFIVGNRYNSTSVHNYDLCESCKRTGYFDSSHGPYVKIQYPVSSHPSNCHGRRNFHGRCGKNNNRPPCGANRCGPRRGGGHPFFMAHVFTSEPRTTDQQQTSEKKTPSTDVPVTSAVPASTPAPAAVAVVASPTPVVHAPAAQATVSSDNQIPAQWKSKIDLLQSLGFVEWKTYLPILESENGDLERTIARIISLNA